MPQVIRNKVHWNSGKSQLHTKWYRSIRTGIYDGTKKRLRDCIWTVYADTIIVPIDIAGIIFDISKTSKVKSNRAVRLPIYFPVTRLPIYFPVTSLPIYFPVTRLPICCPVTRLPIYWPVTRLPIYFTVLSIYFTVTRLPIYFTVTRLPICFPVIRLPIYFTATRLQIYVRLTRLSNILSGSYSVISTKIYIYGLNSFRR